MWFALASLLVGNRLHMSTNYIPRPPLSLIPWTFECIYALIAAVNCGLSSFWKNSKVQWELWPLRDKTQKKSQILSPHLLHCLGLRIYPSENTQSKSRSQWRLLDCFGKNADWQKFVSSRALGYPKITFWLLFYRLAKLQNGFY